MKRSILLILIICAIATSLLAQSTRILRGRVLNLQGAPFPEVRLSLAGYGTPRIQDNGEFQIELPASLTAVDITLEDSSRAVLAPYEGRLILPADPQAVVTVIVDQNERTAIAALMAERMLQLERVLAQNTGQRDSTLNELSGAVREILQLLKVDEAQLRETLELKRRRLDVLPEMMQTIEHYLIEVKDLRDVLIDLLPLAREGKEEAFNSLQLAIEEYNRAFVPLESNRERFQQAISIGWRGTEAELLRRDLDDVMNEALDHIHSTVKAAQPYFIEMQMAFRENPGRYNRKKGETAAGKLYELAQQLSGLIPALERQLRQFSLTVQKY